jgi:hypothetical protein
VKEGGGKDQEFQALDFFLPLKKEEVHSSTQWQVLEDLKTFESFNFVGLKVFKPLVSWSYLLQQRLQDQELHTIQWSSHPCIPCCKKWVGFFLQL